MAIDTKQKRLSAMDFGDPILLPNPDALIDEGDKAHLLGLYSGIDIATPAPPSGAIIVSLLTAYQPCHGFEVHQAGTPELVAQQAESILEATP